MLYWLLMMLMMVIVSNNDKLQIVSASCVRRIIQTMFWLTLNELYQTIWPILMRQLAQQTPAAAVGLAQASKAAAVAAAAAAALATTTTTTTTVTATPAPTPTPALANNSSFEHHQTDHLRAYQSITAAGLAPVRLDLPWHPHRQQATTDAAVSPAPAAALMLAAATLTIARPQVRRPATASS
jgi:hypothetical protein